MDAQSLFGTLGELGWKYWIILGLGIVLIWAFASEKYDKPTYQKTSIGNLGELSPRSLASDERYLKGFYIYLFWLVSLYLIFCAIGPKALQALGLPIPEGMDGSELWPIGAASALVTVGALSDDSFPGKLEALIRRKAHEAAYIPKAVQNLAAHLASLDLERWLRNADGKAVATIQQCAFGGPAPAIANVAGLTEGKLVSWVRGVILLHAFQHLPKSYEPITSQGEPRAAFRFLESQRISIQARLAAGGDSILTKVDDALCKDIDQLLEGASVLLAATMLQTTPDARNLSQIVGELGLNDIDAASPQGWQQCATVTVACIGAAVFAVWAAFYFSNHRLIDWSAAIGLPTQGLTPEQVGDLSDRIHQAAINSVVTYTVIVLVLMFARERSLNRGTWEGRMGSFITFILWAGIPAGLLASVALLVLPWATLNGAYSILLSTLAISLLTAGFFVQHMRAAATCRDDRATPLRTVFGTGVLLNAAAALVMAGLVILITQRVSLENAPRRSMTQIQSDFNGIADKLLLKEGVRPERYVGQYSQAEIDTVRASLGDIKEQIDVSPTLNGMIDGRPARQVVMDQVGAVCDTINAPLEQKIFEPQSARVAPCTMAGGLADIARTDADKAFVRFGKNLRTFYNNVAQLNAAGLIESLAWLQVFITGTFSVVVTLVLGLALRANRIAQLRNNLDQFDETTLSKLKDRAADYLTRRNGGTTVEGTTVENWLTTPNGRIKNLTPIEGIRYAPYRAPLFDSVPPPQPPEGLRLVQDRTVSAA